MFTSSAVSLLPCSLLPGAVSTLADSSSTSPFLQAQTCTQVRSSSQRRVYVLPQSPLLNVWSRIFFFVGSLLPVAVEVVCVSVICLFLRGVLDAYLLSFLSSQFLWLFVTVDGIKKMQCVWFWLVYLLRLVDQLLVRDLLDATRS